MRNRTLLPLSLAIGLGLSPVTRAADPITWSAAFRARTEVVDTDAFDDRAVAHTARLRLGAKWTLSPTLSAFLEGEAVQALNDRFNSGANGETAYPVVTDATAREINQAGLMWHTDRADIVLGRQRIVFDNQRFIGNVAWRQNEQTFDAAQFAFRPNARTTLHYAWLDRVHRIAGDRALDPRARERNLDAHLLHATLTTPAGPLAAYGYGIEDRDVATASSRTLGARWTGSLARDPWRWGGTLEAAQQNDYGNNPLQFGHGYRLAEASLGRGSWTWKAGWERLAGNGAHAFQTPLATLHAFNGWADVFLVTPATGLEDRYLGLGGAWAVGHTSPIDWSIAWHTYGPTQSGPRYGHEWNASAGTKLGHGWSVLLKVADYRSEGFARDTRKAWLQLEWAR